MSVIESNWCSNFRITVYVSVSGTAFPHKNKVLLSFTHRSQYNHITRVWNTHVRNTITNQNQNHRLSPIQTHIITQAKALPCHSQFGKDCRQEVQQRNRPNTIQTRHDERKKLKKRTFSIHAEWSLSIELLAAPTRDYSLKSHHQDLHNKRSFQSKLPVVRFPFTLFSEAGRSTSSMLTCNLWLGVASCQFWLSQLILWRS